MSTMRIAMVDTSFGRLPVTVPNEVVSRAGFYVSFNDHDIGIYGCATTALVIGQGERFYILNGDHRAGYASLIDLGLDACMTYFKEKSVEMNRFSDKIAA